MKNIRKIIGVIGSVMLLVMGLTTLSFSYGVSIDDIPMETLVIQVKDASLAVLHTEEDALKTEYDTRFFDVNETVVDSQHIFKITAIEGAEERTFEDRVFLYIPKENEYKEIRVLNENSGVFIDRIDANLNIVNTNGALSLTVPEVLKHDINYISEDSSGSVRFYETTTNYELNFNAEESSYHVPYEEISTTGTYKKGDGSHQINISIKRSAFSINEKK